MQTNLHCVADTVRHEARQAMRGWATGQPERMRDATREQHETTEALRELVKR